MKKNTIITFMSYILLGAGILFLVIVSLIINDSRDYFEEYFEVKRDKLNLMDEASVDSLTNTIILNKKSIDSLSVIVTEKANNIEDLKTNNEDLKSSNYLLQMTINHQNEIIKDCKE